MDPYAHFYAHVAPEFELPSPELGTHLDASTAQRVASFPSFRLNSDEKAQKKRSKKKALTGTLRALSQESTNEKHSNKKKKVKKKKVKKKTPPPSEH
jgi:hypothetical protein